MAVQGAGDTVVDPETLIARVNLISHATVRTAVDRLRDVHRITDPDIAFRSLYRVAKRHDVKLRHLAAAVVSHDASSTGPEIAAVPAEPRLPFASRGRGALRPVAVLDDLLATATELTGARMGAVHLRHAVHGGLCIESSTGLSEEYRRHFSYVDDAGSVAGRSSARCAVIRVDDVATHPVYTRADAAVLADQGIAAELAVPMCDESGENRGAVVVQFDARHPHVDPFAVEMLHGHADACAQWLWWYDQAVVPGLVAAVHAHAAQLGAVEAPSTGELASEVVPA